MKIGVFADPHYCSSEVLCRTRRPRLSYEKVRQVMEAFRHPVSDRSRALRRRGDTFPDSGNLKQKGFETTLKAFFAVTGDCPERMSERSL